MYKVKYYVIQIYVKQYTYFLVKIVVFILRRILHLDENCVLKKMRPAV